MSIWGFSPKLYLYLGAVPGTRDAITIYQSSSHHLSYYQQRYLQDLDSRQVESIIEVAPPEGMRPINELPGFRDSIYKRYRPVHACKACIFYLRKN